MSYNKQQLISMIGSFNLMSFKAKLETIRDHKSLLRLDYDNGWVSIQLNGVDEDLIEDIQKETWFKFDGEAFNNSSNLWDLLTLANLV